MTDFQQPPERPSVNSHQEAEAGNNADFLDRKDQLELLELSAADSKQVETKNADGEPPRPPDFHPETTPEPTAMESPTVSLVPAPNSEEAGISKSVMASEQPQAVFGVVEVRRRWIERITW